MAKDTIFAVARCRYNRALGYYIIETLAKGNVWEFYASYDFRASAVADLQRFSCICEADGQGGEFITA